jgi:hypothetical protein
MVTRIRLIVDKLIPGTKRIFLIDALGAVLTAFFLGIILAGLKDYFGMPVVILYFLSIVAFFYAAYSFCCYFFISKSWRPYLKAIVVANMVYCCSTIGLVFYFYQILTIPGLIYFLLEVIVMSCLILIELMMIYEITERK